MFTLLLGASNFLCHQSKDWISYYFSNFLNAKHSNGLNKYLLNVKDPDVSKDEGKKETETAEDETVGY